MNATPPQTFDHPDSATVDAQAGYSAAEWTTVCPTTDITREQGVAALVNGIQVAVFRTHQDEYFAVSNRDPFTGANVLARGIVGSRGGAPTVASPLHKQVFDLASGGCLDDPSMSVPTFPVRARLGFVEVATPPLPAAEATVLSKKTAR